jgi:uncharacterized protein YecE (DUF72 family)
MHLARVENEKNGDSHPPTGHDGKTRQLYVGCSGWFYWHWRGTFYPADLPTSRWFAHYAGRFKTVELNAPFYSWPTVATVGSWIRQAGRHQFVYTVKVCELITHIKRFAGTKTLVRDFGLIADLAGPRMGCFLFQLPPSFHFTHARLKRILDQFDHRRRNVVEFRHKSWWNETVYEAFRETGTIFCSCSGPRLPEKLIQTADDIYIRFHGDYGMNATCEVPPSRRPGHAGSDREAGLGVHLRGPHTLNGRLSCGRCGEKVVTLQIHYLRSDQSRFVD